MKDENKPFFSVIVPVYNKEPHIARSINSILNQTFTGFELIIVCDPSTDNSNDEVAKFSDPRIRVFHRDEPGPGGYAARNLGIKNAKADWIAFLDADDEWYPEHLENFFELTKKHQFCNVLAAGWHIKNRGKYWSNPYYKKNKKKGVIIIDIYKYLKIHSKNIDVIHTNAIAVKKDLLISSGMFPISNCDCMRAGDGETWLRIMLNNGLMVWSPHIASIYYQDAINMVTRIKLYPISENCLLTFIKKEVSVNSQRKVVKGLLKYYKSRYLSNALKFAKAGALEKDMLKYLFLNYTFNIKSIICYFCFIAPNFTRKFYENKFFQN